MKKTLFVIIASYLAITSAFSQIPIEFQLNENKLQDNKAILDHDENELGRIFVKIIDESNSQGQTAVQLELENSSKYSFLLFDRVWSKKELRKKPNCIVMDKYFGGETTLKVENIKLINKDGIEEIKPDERYTFRELLVNEGETYECKIPIHLAEPKRGLFCKKRKKMNCPFEYTIQIKVDTKDKVYEKLKLECDSLLMAFDEALERKKFCTNARHVPSFDEQTEEYFNKIHELGNQVYQCIKNCPTESKKHKRYDTLWDSINKMEKRMLDDLEYYKSRKYDCGQHKRQVSPSCNYCKLTLKDIWKRMQSLYLDLRNEEKQRDEVLKEANDLYNCCTNHKKQERQWKNSEYKKAIEEYYKSIKNY